MAHSINISDAIIVLGDRDTTERGDLADRAAALGATITESYGFEPGQAAAHDNISEVEAVVTAISRAITTHTDVWVPFPFPDFGREQHVRRISLVLQRHGVNMLLGQDLEPCTIDGGFNAIDYAMREEVRSVDELDHAAVAGAGIRPLFDEIERELAAHRPAPEPVDPEPVGERCFSTAEVARFFGMSVQWVDRGLRRGIFTDRDGTPIEPMRVGKSGRRRFTLAVMRAMALSCYRSGVVSEQELSDLLAVLDFEGGDGTLRVPGTNEGRT